MRTELCGLILASLSVLAACDGIGRPVVDRARTGDHPGLFECGARRTPLCRDRELAPVELTGGADPRLPACAGTLGARAEAVSLSNCTLSLRTSDSEPVEIAGSSLSNVRVEIDGATFLRVADSQLFKVTLHFEASTEDVSHSLHVTHSDVRVSDLRADHTELISTVLQRSRLETGDLSAIDIEAIESLILPGSANIAGSSLRSTRITECETLLIAESRLITSSLDACAGVTRLYDLEATACTIDGELESDVSSFVDGRFGVRERTQLHGWNTTLDNSALCGAFDAIRYSLGSLTCVTCEGPLARTDADVCLASPATNSESNACEALAAPPMCKSFPRRARPVIGD